MNDAWLVVIDMQNIFSTPGQYWGCPDFASIVTPIQNLINGFPGRTIMTRFVAGPPNGSWSVYYSSQYFSWAQVPPTDPLYDIVTPLNGLVPEQFVVTATTFSKWDVIPPITGDYPQLYLAGVATDCCVLSTAISAAEAGAYVTVLMDACAGSSATNQAAAQNIFEGYQPLIATAQSSAIL